MEEAAPGRSGCFAQIEVIPFSLHQPGWGKFFQQTE
jgi:hypothetical protein